MTPRPSPPARLLATARLAVSRRLDPLVAPEFLGALAGLCVGVVAFSLIRFEVRPFDGTAGPPAFYDFPPRRKLWGYAILTGGAILGAWIAGAVARRFAGGGPAGGGLARDGDGRPGSGPGAALAVALALAALAILAVVRLPPMFRHAYAPYKFDPTFHLPLAALIAVGVGLSRGATRGRFDGPDGGDGLEGAGGAAERLAWRGGLLALLFAQLWLVVRPLVEGDAAALGIAATFAALFAAVMPGVRTSCEVSSESPREASDAPSTTSDDASSAAPSEASARAALRFERLAWAALALLPLGVLVRRFGRTVGWSWCEAPDAWTAAGFGAVALALVASSFRCRLSSRCATGEPEDSRGSGPSPLWCLPFAAAALYRGCGVGVTEYDAYHQGEYVHAWAAMKLGAVPYRDLFFVHGIGFNVLPGLAVDRLLERAPNLDIHFLDLITTAAVVAAGFLYLRAWGGRWWLLAFALAFCTAGGAATKGSRYAPIYFQALALAAAFDATRAREEVAASVARGKGGALAFVAGCIAGAGVLFTLDTGPTGLVAGGVAVAAMSAGFGARAPARLPALHLAAGWLAGAGAVLGGFLAWLVARGLLGEFLELHLEYAAMKHHYDNLPLAQPGLLHFLSPAATVVAALALASWRRSESGAETGAGSAIPPLLLFFAVGNVLSYLRGLDRSDTGHLLYANQLAWPTLGMLVALRGGGRRARATTALGRSLAFVAALLLLPFASPALRGETLSFIDPWKMAGWYADESATPAALPKERLETPFFAFVEELREELGGRPFVDLTGRPALYRWLGSPCPTRFHAIYYAPNLTWQREIAATLERDRPPVLWPAPDAPLRAVDGIDLQIRHWAVAATVLARYRPSRVLSDGTVLLEWDDGRGPGATDRAAGDAERAILEGYRRMAGGPIVSLGNIPCLWGRHGKGTRDEATWIGGGNAPVSETSVPPAGATLPSEALSAVEFAIAFDAAPPDGEAEVEIRAVAPDADGTGSADVDGSAAAVCRIRFRTRAGSMGPYVLPVSSFVAMRMVRMEIERGRAAEAAVRVRVGIGAVEEGAFVGARIAATRRE